MNDRMEIVEDKLSIVIRELEYVKDDLKEERGKSSNLEQRLNVLMDGGKGISVDIKGRIYLYLTEMTLLIYFEHSLIAPVSNNWFKDEC